MAAFDFAMTQHCIADHHCQERNPLIPSLLAGRLDAGLALDGYWAVVSYELKKRDSDLWPFSPAIGMATHTVGIATGCR